MNRSAWDKFQGATLSLVGAGALKERITSAYRNHLSHIEETELPRELREDFRLFSLTVTREPPLVRGDDAFRATLRKMSNGEAEEVATAVVRMFSALPRAPVVPLRAAPASQVMPLYIAESRVAEA